MHRFWLPFLCLLLLSSSSLAAWNCCEGLDLSVELRVAFFRPNSGKVKRIFGNGWADYQLEISKQAAEDWRIWVGVGGFSKSGSLPHDGGKVHVNLIPVYLGFKYDFLQFCRFKMYAGAAVNYGFMHLKENFDYGRRNTHKNQWGGLIQLGLNYDFLENVYAGLYVDYFFEKFHLHQFLSDINRDSDFPSSSDIITHTLDLRGFKMGACVGVAF